MIEILNASVDLIIEHATDLIGTLCLGNVLKLAKWILKIIDDSGSGPQKQKMRKGAERLSSLDKSFPDIVPGDGFRVKLGEYILDYMNQNPEASPKDIKDGALKLVFNDPEIKLSPEV